MARINPPRLPRDPAICPRCGKKREPEAGVLCRACRDEFNIRVLRKTAQKTSPVRGAFKCPRQ
jgi:NMD protein affecting ribosome stability and mRNA decay